MSRKRTLCFAVPGWVKKVLSEGFAGAYIRRTEAGEYEFTVIAKGTIPEGVAQKYKVDRVIEAQYNERELEAGRKRLAEAVQQMQLREGLHGIGIDLPANRLVIEIAAGGDQAAQNLMNAAQVPPDMAIVRVTPGNPPPTAFVGGEVAASEVLSGDAP